MNHDQLVREVLALAEMVEIQRQVLVALQHQVAKLQGSPQ